jgi:hypothetical protein
MRLTISNASVPSIDTSILIAGLAMPPLSQWQGDLFQLF